MSSFMKQFVFIIIYLASSLHSTPTNNGIPKKRQIYREQVLPHAGGRIPDTAFETDRLFLNQLQKDGIAIPDGIVLEQRNPQVYPFSNRASRKVYRVALSSDGRFTPSEGRTPYHQLTAIDTTYLYPQIHGEIMDLKPSHIALPIYRPFRLPNPLLNQLKLQPFVKDKDRSQYQIFGGNGYNSKPTMYKWKTYQNFNLLKIPWAPSDLTTTTTTTSEATTSTSALNLADKFDLSAYNSDYFLKEFDEPIKDLHFYNKKFDKYNSYIIDRSYIPL